MSQGAVFSMAASEICKNLTPAYFIQDGFLRACLATEPPDGMPLSDVKFPMSAFTLVLSWSIQREIFSGLWVPYIQVANLQAGEFDVLGGRRCENSKHHVAILATGFTPTGKPVDLSSLLSADAPITKLIGGAAAILDWESPENVPTYRESEGASEDRPKATTQVEKAQTFADIALEIEEKYPDESERRAAILEVIRRENLKINDLTRHIDVLRATSYAIGFFADALTNPVENKDKLKATVAATVLKTVLALSVRPELIEQASLLRSEKMRRGVIERDALWSPIIIGRAYRILSDSQHGEGFAKRMHWRRGHFRHQRYGLGNSSVKMIWIEPVLVNAPE